MGARFPRGADYTARIEPREVPTPYSKQAGQLHENVPAVASPQLLNGDVVHTYVARHLQVRSFAQTLGTSTHRVSVVPRAASCAHTSLSALQTVQSLTVRHSEALTQEPAQQLAVTTGTSPLGQVGGSVLQVTTRLSHGGRSASTTLPVSLPASVDGPASVIASTRAPPSISSVVEVVATPPQAMAQESETLLKSTTRYRKLVRASRRKRKVSMWRGYHHQRPTWT